MRLTTTVAGAGLLWLVLTCAPTMTTAQVIQSEAEHTNEQQILSQRLTGSLTLAEAMSLTLQHNPGLAAFAEEIRAKDAAALQAGLFPNPTLAVDVENFAGEDERQGFDAAETTIALSQRIELGGKRSKRRQVATLEKELAGWDYQSQKRDLLTATTKAFFLVLTTQEQVTQKEELAALTEQTLVAVTARVEAGKTPPLDETRARIELASAETMAAKASRELEAARRRLVAFWGAEQADFGQVVGDLTALSPLPAEESIQQLIDNNPDVARWGTELEQREASLALARVQAIPDVSFSFGVRNQRDSDNNTLVAGIELPLPFFDRNQGGAGEARAKKEMTRHERQAAETETRTRLVEAWQALAAAHSEATTLQEEILPWAESVFEAADFGYREGKFDFLQMIDAQRTLFAVKGQYLLSLATYHQLRTEVEHLIGAPLHELPAL